MSTKRIGLYWFTNDLRLHDQPALMRANSLVDELVCIFIFDKAWFQTSHFSQNRLGSHRRVFLLESLHDLDQRLCDLGQKLIIVEDHPTRVLSQLIQTANITDVFRSENAGWNENQIWRSLESEHTHCQFHSIDTHTLFDQDGLPFSINELPATFTKFRKVAEETPVASPIKAIQHLPPKPTIEFIDIAFLPEASTQFNGGETAALAHVENYFGGKLPAHYKEVRNSLDGWDNSTKLSPWLACGCLSPRAVYSRLSDYEARVKKNESTYWIYFELLWREFFQWYAHKYANKLFLPAGIKKTAPLNSYYPERFQKWVNGNTPFPIVNACMNELSSTGYLSNRGRQIVASCFVNELAMDWRYGAAYFEKMLIDYDVAANWGNWQYLAGVGADVQPKRHFNLEKQTEQFDPHGRYIKKWAQDNSNLPLDSTDAADWPIS